MYIYLTTKAWEFTQKNNFIMLCSQDLMGTKLFQTFYPFTDFCSFNVQNEKE